MDKEFEKRLREVMQRLVIGELRYGAANGICDPDVGAIESYRRWVSSHDISPNDCAVQQHLGYAVGPVISHPDVRPVKSQPVGFHRDVVGSQRHTIVGS